MRDKMIHHRFTNELFDTDLTKRPAQSAGTERRTGCGLNPASHEASHETRDADQQIRVTNSLVGAKRQ